MPKLKRASSAHSAIQANRRKRSQREERGHNLRSHTSSEVSCEENSRRVRDDEAHRSARCDPERRQLEQEHNTAAQRQLCRENPGRRQEEQEHHTEAHRQTRSNPENRTRELQVNNV